MKVLHISTRDRGGAAQAGIRLHKALLEQGVDSSFLFIKPSTKSIPNSTYVQRGAHNSRLLRAQIKFNIKKPIELHNRDLLEQAANNSQFECFSFSTSSVDITKTKAYQQADIVHLHWIGGILDYPSFFRQCTKPVIWTLHDMNAFLGGFHYQGDVVRNKDNMMLMKLSEETLYLRYKALQDFGRLTIVTPSRWLMEASKQSMLFNKYSHHHIYNGLDTNIFKFYDQAFARSVFNIPEGPKMFLFVSDLLNNHRKGMDMLLEALDKMDEEEIIVCAVGDGVPLSSRKNINLILLDSLQDERLISLLYASADFVVIPSREDNLPNVMIEALACGTPVISFPIGGLGEVLENGSNGVVAEQVTADSLVLAMKEALAGRFDFDRTNIIKLAHQQFNITQQAKLYQQVYQKSLL
ncbi:MAG: glycosyltransferase [Cyclobacteriaceae bacterium]